jgi:hypothetical protein
MSRRCLFVFTAALTLAVLAISPLSAQQQAWPIAPDPATETLAPTAWMATVQDLDAVQQIATPAIDRQAVQLEDDVLSEQGLPPRFAIPNSVLITPSTGGTWEAINSDTLLWRLRVTCPGALSINLGFTRYRMPPGGHMFLYAADGSSRTRAFTDADNTEPGEFWSPVVLSDDIIVELTIPQAALGDLQLELGSINHGYRFFGEKLTDAGPKAAGACEIDVICPDGDLWRNEIPAIGVFTLNGSWTCSGSMINNTASNQTPLFLTANHCGVTTSTAGSMVLYWNYYSPACGQHGNGSLTQYQSGSTFKATSASSDFTLVQLNAAPNSLWKVTFAGWDRTDTNTASPVGIHHPDCKEKSISFTTTSTTITTYLSDTSPGDASHLKVTWLPTATNRGVTEPGSSGSPIFDTNHRIRGQLHGGYSACGVSDMRDWYGRVFKSWTGGGTSATRLSDWLDPGNTGATAVDTLNPYAGLVTTPATGLSSSGGAGGPFSPSSTIYTLTNQSTTSINYTVSKVASWVTLSSTGGSLAAGGSTNITVSINSTANTLTVGTYNDTVTFTNTTNHQGDTTRPVTLQVLPALTVTPADGLTSTGSVGGPFSPSSKVYTLQNQSGSSIDYTVGKAAGWVTLSGAGGTLAGGGSTNITVSINSTANSLTVGSYNDTVTFTNTTNHSGDTTRPVNLTVNPLSNDTCANAFVVCPGTYTGTTVGMTLDSGVSVSCDGSSPGADVWYKYTPGSTASATISLCSSTTVWDSVLSIHTGSCPGTTQVACSDDDCSGSGGRHGTITTTLTGGTTYLIRIGGYASSNSGPFTLTITGPACASTDTTPPTPNPMTFATPPAPAGINSISMTASTASDPTTPINYFFHFVSGGTGGADSAWQLGTAYTNTGLTPNTSYTYQVKARDGATPTPNETAYSTPAASTATLIETPTGVSFGTVTNNSIVLNAGGTLTNLTTATSGVYFNSTTAGGNGGLNVWQQTTTDTATGLSPNTSYSFQVKARNQSSVETAYSATAAKVTLANAPTAPALSGATRTTLNLDVNANSNPAATEFAVMCTGSTPADLNWNGKYVSAAGGASATAVWRTEAQWAVTTVAGLQPCTTYTFAAKARNSDLLETAFSPGASLATAGHLGDMDGDGNVDGADIQAFVTCAVSGGSGCACANMSVSAFVNCLLNVGTCP